MAAAEPYHVAVGEEEVWKCPKHPSKRRRNGVCPTCLRDRLAGLCPHCANVRPCPCASTTTTPSSSSPSSSASSSGRASHLIDGEPSFRRSRSVAFPFLRSGSRRATTPSFLSVLSRNNTKRSEPAQETNEAPKVNSNCVNGDENLEVNEKIEDFARMITRSRSVSTGTTAMASGFRRGYVTYPPKKRKFWHFPSPMKLFRSSKTPKVVVQN